MSGREPTVGTCRYRHEEYGDISIKVNASARRIVARRVGAELRITIPKNLPESKYLRFLEENRQWILEHKPAPTYSVGQRIDCPEVDFSIVEAWENDRSDIFLTMVEKTPQRHKFKNYYIHLSARAVENIARAEVQEYIYKILITAARDATGRFVVPMARELARRVGRSPLGWAVKESKTRLGSCSSAGLITLSPRLIFLPHELREFVIYHELAHLSEMNHSAAFHEICNSYCGGREADLSRRLRSFRFPLL